MLTLLTILAGNLLLWLWLAAAGVLWWMTRGHRRSRRGIAALLVVLWLLSCLPVAELFLLPLERRYDRPSVADLEQQGVRQVVVLTGGGFSEREELLSGALPPASAARFLSGLELCSRLGPDCRLIFSGAAGRGRRDLATAITMRELALRLTPGSRVAAEARSGSTAEHPRNVHPLLEGDAFILVTSGYHMPRAVRSFRRSGLDPIPYPVDRAARGGHRWHSWLPSVEGLRALHLAWREYLALTLYSLRGW